jgi:hypothetical protein
VKVPFVSCEPSHWLNDKCELVYPYATGLTNNGSHQSLPRSTTATMALPQPMMACTTKVNPLPTWQRQPFGSHSIFYCALFYWLQFSPHGRGWKGTANGQQQHDDNDDDDDTHWWNPQEHDPNMAKHQQHGISFTTLTWMKFSHGPTNGSGSNENTFPRHALPIHGHWQGSSFIVEHLDHWTNTPTTIQNTCSTTQWQYPSPPLHLTPQSSLHVISALTCSTIPLAQWQTRKTSLTYKRNTTSATNMMDMTHPKQMTGKSQPKLAPNTLTWQSRKQSNNNPKDSKWSIKWHPQARLKIWWTKQHLDSYLALAEVICEWNIDPG